MVATSTITTLELKVGGMCMACNIATQQDTGCSQPKIQGLNPICNNIILTAMDINFDNYYQ